MHQHPREWLTAVGFTMLTSKASLLSQEGPRLQGAPPDLSVCVLALAIRRRTHKKLLSTEPVAQAGEFQLALEVGEGHVHYLAVPVTVVGASALASATEEV